MTKSSRSLFQVPTSRQKAESVIFVTVGHRRIGQREKECSDVKYLFAIIRLLWIQPCSHSILNIKFGLNLGQAWRYSLSLKTKRFDCTSNLMMYWNHISSDYQVYSIIWSLNSICVWIINWIQSAQSCLKMCRCKMRYPAT